MIHFGSTRKVELAGNRLMKANPQQNTFPACSDADLLQEGGRQRVLVSMFIFLLWRGFQIDLKTGKIALSEFRYYNRFVCLLFGLHCSDGQVLSTR